MIRKSMNEDLSEITDILTEAFNMNKVECDNMLEMIEPEENTFVYQDSGEIVSVASVISCFADNKKVKYIYAVATKKNKRNNSYAGKLLKYIVDYFKEDDVVMLRPAEPGLFDYYKKLGFTSLITADIAEYKNGMYGELKKCSYNDYFKFKKIYSNFSFPQKVINYYIKTYDYIPVIYKDAVALYRKTGDICYIDEIFGKNTNELIAAIIFAEKAKKAVVTQEGNTPFGLAHFYKNEFKVDFRIPME